MKRGRTLSGLAALLVLSAAAVAAVVMVIALVKSDDAPQQVRRVTRDDTPLIVVEDKVVTQFHLDVGREYHRLRAGKDGFVLPDYGILRDAATLAAWELILKKYGQAPTPEEIDKERARQIAESRDRETMNKILALLDQYPGMFEWIMVRPALANNRIHKLQQSRELQPEAYAKAQEGLKEALSNPDFFRGVNEKDPASYQKDDSRDPLITHNPKDPGPPLPQHMKDPARQRIKDFAKKWLSTVNPGQVCPNVIDEDGAYIIAKLIEKGPDPDYTDYVVYEVVVYRKSMYDAWFEGELRKLKGEIKDPKTRETMKEGLKDHVIMRWLESN